MSNETGELDLQAILKKAEQQTDFPDVPLDEFTPPTYEERKEACITLLKGAPFDKKMYTKTYEGITFDPMYFRKDTEDILPKEAFPGMGDYLRGAQPSGYVGKPWGIAQDILIGYYCDVDGDDTIKMDPSELKYAEWVRREDIVLQPTKHSLTNEMMTMFKNGMK